MDDESCGTGGLQACPHWSVFNISNTITSFSQGEVVTNTPGVIEGYNYTGMKGYSCPCSPSLHEYILTVYALDSNMPVIDDSGDQDQLHMTRQKFENNYAQYILDSASIVGYVDPNNL